MNWLYFSSKKDRTASELEKTLRQSAALEQISAYYGYQSLGCYLENPHLPPTHALVLIRCRADLEQLDGCLAQLTECRLILALAPEVTEMENAELFKFHPSYIACLPTDEENVQAVIRKMVLYNYSSAGKSLG